MYQFLSYNKKYKYEEFFIDEYAELNDIICYIEEKILILYWYFEYYFLFSKFLMSLAYSISIIPNRNTS